MYIDTHCHLDYLQKNNNLNDVIQAAQTMKVDIIHTISTRLDESAKIKAIANEFNNVYCSIGVHPNETTEVENQSQENITAALLNELNQKVISIGETGLDYYYEYSSHATQKKSFQAHIDAAAESNLPLVIHTRDAEKDTLSLLKENAHKNITGIIHCFTGTAEMAKACLDLGYYISVSGIVTFKKAEVLQDIVKWVPIDRLLIETDAPYLAPVPYRGKPNQPAYVVHVAEKVAELKGMSLSDVAKQTAQNFLNLCPQVQGFTA